MIKLGIGVIPTKETLEYIFGLSDKIRSLDLHQLSQNKENTPHMTLFQGKFKESDQEEVKNRISQLDFSSLKFLTLKSVSRWGEWIFLDFPRSEKLMEIHNKVCDLLIPFRKGKAIDFLNEEYMTKGQIDSFENTGYQFSYEEFLPHITIFAIPEYKKFKEEYLHKINDLVEQKELEFEKVVIYITGAGGSCSNTIFEEELKC